MNISWNIIYKKSIQFYDNDDDDDEDKMEDERYRSTMSHNLYVFLINAKSF